MVCLMTDANYVRFVGLIHLICAQSAVLKEHGAGVADLGSNAKRKRVSSPGASRQVGPSSLSSR